MELPKENANKITMLQERVAVVETKSSAAHARIDKMELMLRDDFKEIKESIKNDMKEVRDDVKSVVSFIDKSKGIIALITVVAGFLAWVFGKIFEIMFHIK